MRIICVSRKIIIIFILIILIASVVLIAVSVNNPTLAIELFKNSDISEETFNRITNLTKENEKVAFLTFDDGPTTSVTPKVLDILKEEQVTASFFVIGKNVETCPELVKRAYDEGHFIANHGYDHNNKKMYSSEENFKNEIEKTDDAIGKALGIDEYCSHVFRFPNGYMSSNNKYQKSNAVKWLKELNYTYIDWNCLNNDSVKKYSKSQLINNLKRTSKNKNTLVILMHDTKFVSDSSTALKESIEYLKSEGYIFKNFYDIL